MLRIALFGGASAIASWLVYTLLPELFKHGELLAPIAIANGIASSAIYLGETSHTCTHISTALWHCSACTLHCCLTSATTANITHSRSRCSCANDARSTAVAGVDMLPFHLLVLVVVCSSGCS